MMITTEKWNKALQELAKRSMLQGSSLTSYFWWSTVITQPSDYNKDSLD